MAKVADKKPAEKQARQAVRPPRTEQEAREQAREFIARRQATMDALAKL